MGVENMDVVVLCGGLGKRLRSVSADLPKVMVEVNGEPFLNHVIRFYKSQGCRRFILCTGYKSQVIKDYYEKNNQGASFAFSREDEPLGTGGAIKNAQSHVKSDPFFAINGDVFCAVDLKAFRQFHDQKKAVASVATSLIENNTDYGSVQLDADKRILAFKEKQASPFAQHVNAGVYCFTKEIFKVMPKEVKFSLEYDCFPKLVDKGFYGFPIKQEFLDIGTPERLNKAIEVFKNG